MGNYLSIVSKDFNEADPEDIVELTYKLFKGTDMTSGYESN